MQNLLFSGGGFSLFLWSLVNSYVDIQRYGWHSGVYWWFCNLALFGVGLGLMLRSRGLLTGFLSIAVFTQMFWLIDTFAYQFLGHGFFGFVDFRYQPGYPLDEFILGSYHYFPIPVAVTALFFLPQRKNLTLKLVAFFNPFIFGVSYFAFGPSENINCIHKACVSSLRHWQGSTYALGFWAAVFAVHLALAWAFDRFYLWVPATPRVQKFAFAGLAAFVLLGVGVGIRDTQYKMTLPSLACEGSNEDNGVAGGCSNIRILEGGLHRMTFFVDNGTDEERLCRADLAMGGKERVLAPGIPIPSHTRLTQKINFDPPTETTEAKVVLHCQPLRATASKP